MIWVWMMMPIQGVVDFITSLLPDWDPINLSGWVEDISCNQFECGGIGGTEFGGPFFRLFAWANWYVPVYEMVAIISLSVTVWSAVRVLRVVQWVLVRAHILGGDTGSAG